MAWKNLPLEISQLFASFAESADPHRSLDLARLAEEEAGKDRPRSTERMYQRVLGLRGHEEE